MSAHGAHAHDHGTLDASSHDAQRRLAVATVINVVIVVAQVVAGIAANSVGLLADAGHNLTDTAAVALSLVAVRLLRRPASPSRSFGYHRAGILAAQANAAGILVITAVIAVEALRRLGDAPAVDGALVIVVALVAACGNAVAAVIVARGEQDLNMRSAVLHLASDAAVSVVVAAVGAVILLSGSWFWLDPAASLLVSLLIGYYGVRLLRATTEVLLEATPTGLDLDEVSRSVLGVEGVNDLHDLHVWSLSDSVSAASLHVRVGGEPTLQEAMVHGEAVKAALAALGIRHATVELEGETCGSDAACALPVTTGPDAASGLR